MKSNKPKRCFYCNKSIEGQRRFFCSETCNIKYWKGVYRKDWKEGDAPVMEGDFPNEKELEKEKQKTIAHRLAYQKYKRGGILECDICKVKSKNIHRHHENYKSDVCILVCSKCHGFIKRYNNLKSMLNLVKGGMKEK